MNTTKKITVIAGTVLVVATMAALAEAVDLAVQALR